MGNDSRFPVIEEKDVHRVIVDASKVCYKNKSSKYPRVKPMYSVNYTHLPGNTDMKYIILDKYNLITELGEQEIVFRELSGSQIEHLYPDYKEWYNPDMRCFEIDFSVDIREIMRNYDWKRLLNLWVTENCGKDQRLVDAFKSVVVPLKGSESLLQPLNNHMFWITNTSSGKSMFSLLIGNKPNADVTEMGLFGGNVNDYKNQQIGILNGHGFTMIDEINIYDNPIILYMLTYMEQGIVERKLKVPVVCRGTKTLVLSSNPTSKDLLSSFVRFMKCVSSVDHPKRVGRRIGMVLIGSDYREVNDADSYAGLRGPVKRVINYAMVQYYDSKIWPIMKKNLTWIKRHDFSKTSSSSTLLNLAKNIPNEHASDFVKGNALAIPKIRMAALRFFLLDNLDELVLNRGYKSLLHRFENEREEIFERLFKIHLDSLKKISHAFDEITPTKECVKMLKSKYSELSLRDIASIVGVSYVTVDNWLKFNDLT